MELAQSEASDSTSFLDSYNLNEWMLQVSPKFGLNFKAG